jgi:hypothetical protein
MSFQNNHFSPKTPIRERGCVCVLFLRGVRERKTLYIERSYIKERERERGEPEIVNERGE